MCVCVCANLETTGVHSHAKIMSGVHLVIVDRPRFLRIGRRIDKVVLVVLEVVRRTAVRVLAIQVVAGGDLSVGDTVEFFQYVLYNFFQINVLAKISISSFE